MFPNQNSRKKSAFTGSTDVPETAFFDFFTSNGDNFRISKSNFIAAMGATGTIEQVGEVGATQILNVNGTVNQIRSLFAGSGIATSISPLGSAEIQHNFLSGAAGVPVLKNPTAGQPIITSFVAGTGIQLAAGTDTITVTATGVTTPTATIIINEEADFPIQDATTITLSAGIRFVIGASFSTAKRFIGEAGFFLTAENAFGPILTYTGTGDMFTTVDINFTISTITMDSPNAAQTFNCSDSTNTKILGIDGVVIQNTQKVGTFTGFFITSVVSCGVGEATDGITIAGTGQFSTIINGLTIASTSTTLILIDLNSSVIPNIQLTDINLIAPSGSVMLSGAASSANVPSGSLASLSGSSATGGSAPLSGITDDDIRWRFAGNPGIPNTRPDGLTSLVDNATETVITTSSSDGTGAVEVVGTWGIEASSHFTVDTAGRITYDGETPLTAPIDGSINAIMASGSAKNVAAYIAINGVVIRPTEARANISSSAAGAISVHWQHTFQTGDYAEIFLENQSDTTNIIAISGVGRIN